VSDWMVENGGVIGTSPIILPDFCVDCGRHGADGIRAQTRLYWYPGWVWVGIFWGIFPVYLLYLAARRGVDVEYSICSEHVESMKRKKRAGLISAACFVVLLAAAIFFQNPYLGGAALLALVVAAIMYMTSGSPLRAAGHEDGVFGIKGFDDTFLEAAARRSTATATVDQSDGA
jgi:hypothetical protein